MPPEKPHIVFFGHHKCGSRFFRKRLLGRVAEDNGYRVVSYKITGDPFHYSLLDALDYNWVDFDALLGESPVCLHLTNASPRVVYQVLSRRQDILGLHVVRDPRQVWVSNYFHHLDGHPIESELNWVWDRLAQHREKLASLSRHAGLMEELRTITNDVLSRQIEPWRQRPGVLELRLENFAKVRQIHHPKLKRIFNHLGFDRLPEKMNLGHFDNPDAKRWEDVLTPALKAAFKARFGLLLIDLGYETDFDW